MRRSFLAVVLAPLSVLLAGPLLAAPVPIFERVVPVEVQTGVVRVRTAEAPILAVPTLSGESWADTRFDRLYGIQFELETRRRNGTLGRDDRGSVLVAVHASAPDLLRFDEAVHSHLAGLGASAFLKPQAGFLHGDTPIDGLAAISVEPSWTCSGGGGESRLPMVHTRTESTLPNGERLVTGTASKGFSIGEIHERLCPLLDRALAASTPSETRTMPLPREILDQSVELESSLSLPTEARRADLPSLPPGVRYTRRSVENRNSGIRTGIASDGSSFDSTHLLNGIEWNVTTVPSSLSPDFLSAGAWIGRFTFEQSERRLGTRPDHRVTRDTLTVGLIPVVPPPLEKDGVVPEARDPVEVRLDTEALAAEVVQRLDQASTLNLALLEDALVREPAGLRSDGWLLVLCRTDGSASFGLPPAPARSPIVNAPLFCAALDARLP